MKASGDDAEVDGEEGQHDKVPAKRASDGIPALPSNQDISTPSQNARSSLGLRPAPLPDRSRQENDVAAFVNSRYKQPVVVSGISLVSKKDYSKKQEYYSSSSSDSSSVLSAAVENAFGEGGRYVQSTTQKSMVIRELTEEIKKAGDEVMETANKVLRQQKTGFQLYAKKYFVCAVFALFAIIGVIFAGTLDGFSPSGPTSGRTPAPLQTPSPMPSTSVPSPAQSATATATVPSPSPSPRTLRIPLRNRLV